MCGVLMNLLEKNNVHTASRQTRHTAHMSGIKLWRSSKQCWVIKLYPKYKGLCLVLQPKTETLKLMGNGRVIERSKQKAQRSKF